MSWLINVFFFSTQTQGLWPKNLMPCHGQTDELRVAVSASCRVCPRPATPLETRLRKAEEHTPTAMECVPINSQHLYFCLSDDAQFISKRYGTAEGMELSAEPSLVGSGWALRGSSPCPPMGRVSPAMGDSWAASKESLQWWEGAFSPPSSALLLAGKCAFKAQLTKEEQENKMQIRGEINFRRVSFVSMTQLFRGRQCSFGSIKGITVSFNEFFPFSFFGHMGRPQICMAPELLAQTPACCCN